MNLCNIIFHAELQCINDCELVLSIKILQSLAKQTNYCYYTDSRFNLHSSHIIHIYLDESKLCDPQTCQVSIFIFKKFFLYFKGMLLPGGCEMCCYDHNICIIFQKTHYSSTLYVSYKRGLFHEAFFPSNFHAVVSICYIICESELNKQPKFSMLEKVLVSCCRFIF